MLVLSRKKNESIHIAGNIKVTVLDVSGDIIKLGIDAPKNIEIYRSEVFQAIQAENQQAASSKTDINQLSKLLSTITEDLKKSNT
ncbi:carbon storage regulator CsrA [Desulforamulus aquiferis]|uniref:Translational regulator CsrA n=1 Tax=Desulforamulus aquiferis TaxID=1397668 RepID=A0AAW7ZG33_9FIRM|nr:carbon storage regulator CsrA [Desulforamulus aquiferis]MDO7788356.1 carbon storage regulator CsrA [Desulforamulus aquiferis]RYD02977.1 hypothetical protein N752_21880 [Desulforamulus aquiferis]